MYLFMSSILPSEVQHAKMLKGEKIIKLKKKNTFTDGQYKLFELTE